MADKKQLPTLRNQLSEEGGIGIECELVELYHKIDKRILMKATILKSAQIYYSGIEIYQNHEA